jgi:hypothetical protein
MLLRVVTQNQVSGRCPLLFDGSHRPKLEPPPSVGKVKVRKILKLNADMMKSRTRGRRSEVRTTGQPDIH